MKPLYEHNCDYCRYVTTISTPHGKGDLYVHSDPDVRMKGVLIRFSDNLPDYWSVSVGTVQKGGLELSGRILKPYVHDCPDCTWVFWFRLEDGWTNMYYCERDEAVVFVHADGRVQRYTGDSEPGD